MKYNTIRTSLIALLAVLFSNLKAQQTIPQTLILSSNGVNSTEILMRKQDNTSYNSLFSNNLGFGIYNSNLNKVGLFINSNSNVGIGTSDPKQALDVNGNALINGSLVSTIADNNIGGSVQINNPAKTANGAASSWQIFNMSGAYGNSLQFWAYDNLGCTDPSGMCRNRFTLMDNGNVGIGIINPSSKLEISSGVDNDNLSLVKSTIEGAKGAGISFKNLVNNGTLSEIAGVQAKLLDGATGSVKGALSLYTKCNEIKIEAVTITPLGNMGIGITTPDEKLAVNGRIRAREVKVEATDWPDYVFEESYKVGTLEALESYIKTNKHLPEMPSAKEVARNGVELGEMVKLQQKKLEELTLLLIEKDKELKKEKENNKLQDVRLTKIEAALNIKK